MYVNCLNFLKYYAEDLLKGFLHTEDQQERSSTKRPLKILSSAEDRTHKEGPPSAEDPLIPAPI